MVRDVVLVDLHARSPSAVVRPHQEDEQRTWIIVHQEPSSLSTFVSPQIPMMLESSAAHATKRLSESGVTVCEDGEPFDHHDEIS